MPYGYYYMTPQEMAVYIFIALPMVILSMWASYNVNSTYKKYSKVVTNTGLTANDVVRRILDANGLYNVKIEHIAGNLTDHYDPKANVIRLSDSTDGSRSVAAIGVAAHEAGHAVQHSVGYTPIKIRMALVPVCNIGSTLAIPLIIISFITAIPALAYVGIAAFSLATLFQLVTLPVEFDASRRAIAILGNGYLSDDDLQASKKVLKAAALTYVAALAVSIANLLRLVAMVVGRNRD